MICQNIEYVYRAFDSQVIIEMVNIDVYSTQLANQIASDLANNPLAKGEQLNLIDYSGGGQVVLNAAECCKFSWAPYVRIVVKGLREI